MKKIGLLSLLGFLVVSNVTLFVIPSEFTSAFYFAYGFMMAVTLLVMALLSTDKNTKVYNVGKYYLYILAIIVEFAIAMIFKFVEKDVKWIPIVVGTLTLVSLVLASVNFSFANKHIAKVENHVKEKTNFIN